MLHSAAALLRLADMPYGGTTSFFIRVLLDKKYALPYRVVRPSEPAWMINHSFLMSDGNASANGNFGFAFLFLGGRTHA